MDVVQNLLEKTFEICKNKDVNPHIFDRKKFLSKYKNEIQRGYTDIVNVFLTGIPIHKTFIENKDIKDTNLCFEGILGEYLEEIKRKYPKIVWETKNEKKNISKRKKCLR